MRYNVTGGLEQGIHYTRFIEETEDDEQNQSNIQPKESAVKSHVQTDTQNVDTKQRIFPDIWPIF